VALLSVTKYFDHVAAVSELTLEARAGEFLVLLGPSGCGKSTVLRLVAGLEDPSAGTIRIGERDVRDVDPKDRDVAMVFQSYALYPHLTVARNIEFPLRARRVPSAERTRLVADVARSLRLDQLLERKPAQLSGGQRQRVALARAIVRRPRVFLMDEPLSNLDAQLRVEMRAELVEAHARLGITIMYVTHDQVEAMTMGERIAVMNNGVLQQVDVPQVVHDRPANAFVAGFIGSPPMNILRARVTRDSDQDVMAVSGGRLPLTPEHAAALRRLGMTEVVVGVRPEALTLDPAGTVAATVSLVESLGHEQHVACRLPDGQLVMIRLGRQRVVLQTGENVRLSAAAELHLFDPSTGDRIDA
jgi:multiple sugar transport system ATP-binding protein